MKWNLIFLYLFFTINGTAQSIERTIYFHIDKTTIKEKVNNDSIALKKVWDNAIISFQLNGYVGIVPHDTVKKAKVTHYYFDYLKHFKKTTLLSVDDIKAKPIASSNYINTLSNINKKLNYLENNGYPFASLKIIKQVETNHELILHYKIDSAELIIIDKIILKSLDKFNPNTILNLINLKEGDLYNESKIRSLSKIIENSGLYTFIKSPEVIFKLNKAELYIYFQKKKSSNADGYIGFQQDNETQKFVLNGYVNLSLINALNRAEIINLNWKNNPQQTQELKTIFEFPFLFNTPFGIGSSINLQKQDTTFIKSDLLFELIYRNPVFKVSLFNQIENSSTTGSEPIAGFKNYNKNTIGVKANYRPIFNDLLKFYHPEISLMAGVFTYKLDSIEDTKQRIANNKYSVGYSHTIDFLKYFHLNNELIYQTLTSTQGISQNEMIYFGGLQSIRGFYELELFGKNIWTLRNEVEFKPIDVLSIKALYDYSVFNNNQQNYTHSFGVGLGIINNSSQLDIIFANGILNTNPFQLSNSKIHIGFISNF
ncbi:ShlB/FhaC/HecB family hemolysin secretion/activation protein [Crocinitomix catalasitica]|uniref:ShlB/FhaC/HecB family hemolysin secretion/activation protein n=1 Tax=Crocinitomix catalasitica TaxID=184607 RepID=UPI00048430E1|nr:ShlB/FhaC/HecB family hemolysin secretion/activation protein [Crocinitomix catalasitica]